MERITGKEGDENAKGGQPVGLANERASEPTWEAEASKASHQEKNESLGLSCPEAKRRERKREREEAGVRPRSPKEEEEGSESS
jgi:hypothetical protein